MSSSKNLKNVFVEVSRERKINISNFNKSILKKGSLWKSIFFWVISHFCIISPNLFFNIFVSRYFSLNLMKFAYFYVRRNYTSIFWFAYKVGFSEDNLHQREIDFMKSEIGEGEFIAIYKVPAHHVASLDLFMKKFFKPLRIKCSNFERLTEFYKVKIIKKLSCFINSLGVPWSILSLEEITTLVNRKASMPAGDGKRSKMTRFFKWLKRQKIDEKTESYAKLFTLYLIYFKFYKNCKVNEKFFKKAYIYIRRNDISGLLDIFKVGITRNLHVRDAKFRGYEVDGEFIIVFEISEFYLSSVEIFIKRIFLPLCIRKGKKFSEYFRKDILKLLPVFMESLRIGARRLDKEEIRELVNCKSRTTAPETDCTELGKSFNKRLIKMGYILKNLSWRDRYWIYFHHLKKEKKKKPKDL